MSICSSAQPKDAVSLVVKPSGACRLLSCGRTRLYELLQAGELDSFRDGGSRKITVTSIQRYIQRQLAASRSPTGAEQDDTGGRAL
jgi:excisionase family DNA binding protein